MSLTWHPSENIVCFATTDGEVFIHPDFVPAEHVPLLQLPLQPAPFIHDPLAEVSANARRPHAQTGDERELVTRQRRRGTPDTLDDLLPTDDADNAVDGDGFIIDDDGAGYAESVNGYGKRRRPSLEGLDGRPEKRRATERLWQPTLHEPFQPGSTPWRGNRRYLCQYALPSELVGARCAHPYTGLNLVGCVWSVDQETHHTVTVEFYDREYHRDFHFTDPHLYDKACLSECFRAPIVTTVLHRSPHSGAIRALYAVNSH
jgi:chromosome transmission fidelity protein 4